MKKIVLSLSLISLVLNCSSDRSSESFISETTTTIITTPTKQEAKVNITATGRTTYQNIYIMVGTRSGNTFIESKRQALPSNGKTTIDMSEYIGKTMYIKAVEITGSTIKDVSPVRQVSVSANTTQNISLVVSAVQGYKVNITVIKNGKPLANTKVYALTGMQRILLSTSLSENNNLPTAITDSNGVARFTNLKCNTSDLLCTSNFIFAVVSQERDNSNILSKNESIDLNLDDTKINTGTIAFNQTKLTFNFSEDVTGFFLKQDGKYKGFFLTDKYGKAILYDKVKAGNYTIESNLCYTFSPNTISVRENADNIYNINVSKSNMGTLTLENNSSNPYTVTITDANNKTETFTMAGKSTTNKSIAIGSVKVEYKQNSGYVFYPTTGTKSAEIQCGTTSKITFPN